MTRVDPATVRTRPDRCPGVLRPWFADDGLLVRVRLIGGRLPVEALRALLEVAETYGDGRLHLTGRGNVQLRALPGGEGGLDPAVLAALESTGLLPTRSHELVRNVMVSPASGLAGGRADLRPVARELDRLVCADPTLADLSGRFLFVLDDGRGDLVARSCDLGLVALDPATVQLRVGDGWGDVVAIDDAAPALVALAAAFAVLRGSRPEAPWHVAELREPLVGPVPPDRRLPASVGPLPFGAVPGGRHVAAPDGLDRGLVEQVAGGVPEVADVIVTPWHGVLVPAREGDR